MTIVDHLFRDCNLVGKIVEADKLPSVSADRCPVSCCTCAFQVVA